MNFQSYGRLTYPSPYRRGLCAMEEGINRAEGQQGNGLRDSLLWVEYRFRK